MAPVQGTHNSCCVEMLPQPDPKLHAGKMETVLSRCSQCQTEYIMITKGNLSYWTDYETYLTGIRRLGESLRRKGWRTIPPPSRALASEMDDKDWTA